jgi:hypothetical protein
LRRFSAAKAGSLRPASLSVSTPARIGWGERSEPQRSNRTFPAGMLGFATLTPTYASCIRKSLFLMFQAESS